MKTSATWKFRPNVGKIMLGLVLAAMVGSIGVVPSFGEDDHDRRGGRHYEGDRYEHREREHDRDRYRYRHDRDRREYRYYDYRERVYAPPAVVIAPPRPPGIGIFFPPVIFR